MFINGELIESKAINILHLNCPGYINCLKMELEDKYEAIIDLSNEEPEFFIDHIPSSMNTNRFFQN